MKVIKDFLPKNDFEILKKTVIKDIPWYFNDETNPGPKQLNDFYFFHGF